MKEKIYIHEEVETRDLILIGGEKDLKNLLEEKTDNVTRLTELENGDTIYEVVKHYKVSIKPKLTEVKISKQKAKINGRRKTKKTGTKNKTKA